MGLSRLLADITHIDIPIYTVCIYGSLLNWDLNIFVESPFGTALGTEQHSRFFLFFLMGINGLSLSFFFLKNW
jgi:hypothetical protein